MSAPKKRILPTKDSPEIILNPDGNIKIRGRIMKGDYPEAFYQLEEWVNNYISDPADVTVIDIHLEYFNKANVKNFITLLKRSETVRLRNKECIINWLYEEGDEDILEQGEYISSFLDAPLNFIIVQESGPDYSESSSDHDDSFVL